MKPLIFLCVVAGAALVYLMSEATANTTLFARNYTLLLSLGGGLALADGAHRYESSRCGASCASVSSVQATRCVLWRCSPSWR